MPVSSHPGSFTRDRSFLVWLILFAYASGMALLVQLVLLPYVFPAWNGGDGMLMGGDWLQFHRQAVEMAGRIRSEGWSAWELRPSLQATAGIAGAIYALSVPHPWTLIPINAGLHATSGLVVFRLVLLFVSDWRVAALAVSPFALFPSAMLWYTQILKDSYSIPGELLFLFGWVSLVRLQTWRLGVKSILRALICLALGVSLMWVVRPYGVQIMQGVGFGLELLLLGVFLARATLRHCRWGEAVLAATVGLTVIVMMTPLTRDGIAVETSSRVVEAGKPAGQVEVETSSRVVEAGKPAGQVEVETSSSVVEAGKPADQVKAEDDRQHKWASTPWLPLVLDDIVYTIAGIRDDFRNSYSSAASNIDVDEGFHSVSDAVRYLPRAAQIAFLAPFPQQWFKRGSLETNTVMRRVSAGEMTVVYIALAVLPYAFVRWRFRAEIWMILLYCGGLLLIHGLTITNVGALYRVRYGYLMTLVAIGVAGGIAGCRDLLIGRRLRKARKEGAKRTVIPHVVEEFE